MKLDVRMRMGCEFYLFCFCFFLFSLSSLVTVGHGYGWHDQQRVAQIFFLIICLVYSFFNVRHIPASGAGVIGFILILGFMSSLHSREVWWSFIEWSLFVGLIFLSLISALLYRSLVWWRWAVPCIAAVVGCFLAFQFLVFYISSFLSGIRMLDPSFMYGGFSNPRFMGQFQVMLIPLLAGLTCEGWSQNRRGSILCFVVLMLHWSIAFLLDGRGVWAALFLSNLVVFIVAPKFWRIMCLQVLAACLGFILSKIMFVVLPLWIGIEVESQAGVRMGLSAREIIWLSALEMAIEHPWIGVGPMNFSAVANSIAAHPHQIVLQWLAEWGAPATLLAMFVAGRGMLIGVRFVRAEQSRHIDAAVWLAIVSALILAQVDGVFVMPYAQTWLALLVGVAVGQVSRFQLINFSQFLSVKIFMLTAFFVLSYVLLVQAPQLPKAQQAHFDKYAEGLMPRFWSQGWIPMKFY